MSSARSRPAGKWNESKAELRRIIALHPDNLSLQFRLVLVAFSATGSTREADDWLAGLTPAQRDSSDGIFARKWRATLAGEYATGAEQEQDRPFTALAMAASGDMTGARASVADIPTKLRARLENEPANPDLWRQLGIAEALLGRKEEALRAAHKAAELRPVARDAYHGPDFRIALAAVYAWTGDKTAALAELTQILRAPGSGWLGFGVHALRSSPQFAPLREDPRFEALLNDPKNNAPLF